ncbi:UNVERIFIED_CONTAM: hypothetical protein FKN15_024937 [Acipenser sinensis]
MAKSAEDKQVLGLPFDLVNQSLLPTQQEPPATTNQGIVIQLTTAGKEEDWDSLEDNELIFSLDKDEDGGTVIFTKEKASSESGKSFEDGLGSTFHIPTSPSSPSFLSPEAIHETCQVSFHIESKEAASLNPRPLISLVKSISTEISRNEPEVTQSKSDSKLNLHLWRQLTQSKGRNGDSKTAPPSPSISPSESKGGFFKVPEVEARLEDTKRKFSEAMQEPLSMLSKIIGDENSKQKPGASDSPGASSQTNRDSGGDLAGSKNTTRGGECDRLSVCETPLRHAKRSLSKPCLSPEPKCKLGSGGSRYEICTYGDVMQVVEIEPSTESTRVESGEFSPELNRELGCLQTSQPVPRKCLFCIATLAYSYFVLPLPSYMSGLCLGLACGVMVGLVVILLLVPRNSVHFARKLPSAHDCLQSELLIKEHKEPDVLKYFVLPLPSYMSGLCLGLACGVMVGLVVILLLVPRNSVHFARKLPSAHDCLQSELLIKEHKEPDVLKGWMNEMYGYDPEKYLPSLTHSVFITLEGSSLKLSYPKNNIPRRATFDEPRHDAVFTSHRTVELAESKVFLVPPALARKRIWNKKYPICILLAEQAETKMGSQGEQEAEEQRTQSDTPKRGASPEPSARPPAVEASPGILYLFGCTGRDKEEWFQHFLAASRADSEGKENPSRCGSKFGGNSTSRKILRFVDKIAKSKYFQKATENEFIKKKIEEVSNTPLLLTVEVQELSGTLAVNIPPPPTDRLWYSFQIPPRLDLRVRPKLGEREVTFSHVTEWIEKKLQQEFQGPGWECAPEDNSGLQYLHGPLHPVRELQPTAQPLPQCSQQPQRQEEGVSMNRGSSPSGRVLYSDGSSRGSTEDIASLFRLRDLAGSVRQKIILDYNTYMAHFILSESSSPLLSPCHSAASSPSAKRKVLSTDLHRKLSLESHVGGNSTSRKILRFVDKIAKSKYFQKATENEFIKKKIEEVSNTPLLLTVEVQELSGTLAVNIPPPPTDRLWYSFQIPPRLDLRVRPKLGEREVTFSHVTEWIEKKLQQEFQGPGWECAPEDNSGLQYLHGPLHPVRELQPTAQPLPQCSQQPQRQEEGTEHGFTQETIFRKVYCGTAIDPIICYYEPFLLGVALMEEALSKPRVYLLADSDEESSSAGSSDEEEVLPTEPQWILGDKATPPGTEGHVGGNSTSRKILRFVDKIAKSKYFQKATENEFIKKKIEEVSNTPLLLTVEVQELSGTLAVNIPPPPTDRLWYSFQIPPRLDLRVRPKLGEREVTFSHVTEWIEKKLQQEFQNLLTLTMFPYTVLCKHSGNQSSIAQSYQRSKPRVYLLADSDEESSSAGSSDEEEVLPTEPQWILGDKATPPGTEGHVGGNSTSRKILRFVDKIAKSKYFQKATENEFIKKKIEEVSNTPLLLTVEVQELSGTLAVNIPPPPTDRLCHVGGNSTSRKILRFVDKIAKSKYFQKATENEFIKKKIEEVSNTPLLLTVEVQELSGTLAVNIPPPPTDRLWYSFQIPPRLDLRVRPKLGEREVTFSHVTEWIEKKLQQEFQVRITITCTFG